MEHRAGHVRRDVVVAVVGRCAATQGFPLGVRVARIVRAARGLRIRHMDHRIDDVLHRDHLGALIGHKLIATV